MILVLALIEFMFILFILIDIFVTKNMILAGISQFSIFLFSLSFLILP